MSKIEMEMFDILKQNISSIYIIMSYCLDDEIWDQMMSILVLFNKLISFFFYPNLTFGPSHLAITRSDCKTELLRTVT